MAEYLEVFMRDSRMGTLSRDNGRLTFAYDRQWLNSPDRHPLSLSLPLRESPFADAETRIWFGNLLPEGDFLNAVARRLGRSTGDIFGLLVDLGGECAGAVSLLPANHGPLTTGCYQRLEEDELFSLVSINPPPPLMAGEKGVRLSLAGAHNKIPVYVDNNGLCKATGTLATTHILKPAIRAAIPLPCTVENEFFCMQLAGKLGLVVPKAEIRKVRDQTFYLVERYDRHRNGERVERIHQEDTCQALGVEANLKYEESGGPSLAAICRLLLKHSATPAVDVRQLLRWTMFNFLVGNADAHGKNVSLLYGNDGSVRLSPFYDLLCTACYPQLDCRMAMRLGGERHPEKLRRRHWELMSEELGIATKVIFIELERLTRAIETTATVLATDFRENDDCNETINAIQEIIRQRSSRAWAMLGGRPD